MPVMTIAPDENGKIMLAPGITAHVDDIAAFITPANLTGKDGAATPSAIKLHDARVRVLLPVQDVDGKPIRGFTVALVVSREAATDKELVAIEMRKAAGETRKADKVQAEADARQAIIAAKDAEAARRIADIKEMAVAGNDQTANALGKAFSSILTAK